MKFEIMSNPPKQIEGHAGFCVGDWVRSDQPNEKYIGVIVKMDEERVYVSMQEVDEHNDNCNRLEREWACRKLPDGIATADGVWDNKSRLTHVKENERLVERS